MMGLSSYQRVKRWGFYPYVWVCKRRERKKGYLLLRSPRNYELHCQVSCVRRTSKNFEDYFSAKNVSIFEEIGGCN